MPELREFFEMWVPLVAPMVPHLAEEMWHSLGKKHYVKDAPFVAVASLPQGDKKRVDEKLEAAEDYILRVRELAKACGAAWLKTAGGEP